MCALQNMPGLRATAAMTLAACLFIAPAVAKTAAEEDAELSGIETAESTALDREADKLLEQSKKAEAEAQALLARARGKIDPKAMAEALKRGDTSVLFQSSPEEKQARERQDQARKLNEQARTIARQAGDVRARAAVERRCAPASAAAGTAAADGSSPFLAGTVRDSAAKPGRNDPWGVCAAADQYVKGLAAEVDGIQKRAQGLVGQSQWGIPITSDEIERDFGRRSLAQMIGVEADAIKKSFAMAAAGVQHDLAEPRFNSARPYQSRTRDEFGLALSNTYAMVRNAIESTWRLRKQESSYRATVLNTEIDQRQRPLLDEYWNRRNEIWQSVRGGGQEWNIPALQAYLAALHPIAKRYDQADLQFIEATIPKARAIAADLSDASRRLSTDMNHWVAFSARDGIGPGQWGSVEWASGTLDFKINASRVGYYGQIPWYEEMMRFQNDSEWRIWAAMPKNFRQLHPELRWDFDTWDQGGQISSMTIVLPLAGDQTQIAEAVVSGARRGQRP